MRVFRSIAFGTCRSGRHTCGRPGRFADFAEPLPGPAEPLPTGNPQLGRARLPSKASSTGGRDEQDPRHSRSANPRCLGRARSGRGHPHGRAPDHVGEAGRLERGHLRAGAPARQGRATDRASSPGQASGPAGSSGGARFEREHRLRGSCISGRLRSSSCDTTATTSPSTSRRAAMTSHVARLLLARSRPVRVLPGVGDDRSASMGGEPGPEGSAAHRSGRPRAAPPARGRRGPTARAAPLGRLPGAASQAAVADRECAQGAAGRRSGSLCPGREPPPLTIARDLVMEAQRSGRWARTSSSWSTLQKRERRWPPPRTSSTGSRRSSPASARSRSSLA